MLYIAAEMLFHAKYYTTWFMVVVLVLVPCLGIGIMLFVLLAFQLTDWEVFAIASTGIGGSMLVALWVVFKIVFVPCTIAISDNSLEIELDKQNIWYPKNRVLSWNIIYNISGNMDKKHNQPFIQIQCHGSPNFILSPPKGALENVESWELWLALDEKVKTLNLQNALDKQIGQKGFGSGSWVLVIAVLYIGFSVAAIVSKLFYANENISWFELIVFGFLGLFWAFLVVIGFLKRKSIKPNQSSDLDT